MQISPIPPIPPTAATDRLGAGAQPHEATATPKSEPVASAPRVFTPAPPLRPNVQDYVDIDRTLIALREAT